jgi:hypothetical protein
MKDLKLEIKKLKTAGGEETLRFELHLYINNKDSAIIFNAGTGGSHEWRWLNDETEKLFYQNLRKHIAENQLEFGFDYADQLIDELIEERQIKKDCKKHLCIKIKDEHGYRRLNLPDSYELRKLASTWFANKEFEFLNDRYQPDKPKAKKEKASQSQKHIESLYSQREAIRKEGERQLAKIDELIKEAKKLINEDKDENINH